MTALRPSDVTIYPCAECGAPYEQGRRRATPYCPACRRVRYEANKISAQRERRVQRVAENVSDILDDYVRQGMDPDHVEMMRERIDDEADGVIEYDVEVFTWGPLEGANAPAGPDEGYSTYFTDLGEELDAHRIVVAAHQWWIDNPNWWVDMHN